MVGGREGWHQTDRQAGDKVERGRKGEKKKVYKVVSIKFSSRSCYVGVMKLILGMIGN